ncbi:MULTISPECIES: ectoine synthase [unclassified Roseovarius]|uniref:ectoine synthase n=1 Tax=unclassified Roseovarius TaxID=2614913 RepID=UPI00273F08AF|nr:ectoine synthase [Roseovarius sp. MMSF_3350]
MFVKMLDDVIGTEDHAKGEAFESRRLLLARDDLGYSFHDTIVKAGTVQLLEYKNHVEVNYCIEGKGEVENETTGEVWPLEPGVMYVLDQNDPHIVRAETNLRFICIFTPALTGREVHDEDGSYGVPE